MKIENCLPVSSREASWAGKLKISKHGFTLIELLVAIAIVGILAAVVMVSMSSYGKKARASKVLAQLSSAIPSMVSCWGNTGVPARPTATGGNAICSLNGYGNWPAFTGDTSAYRYDLSAGVISLTSPSSWKISVYGDNFELCCNSTMNSCSNIGADMHSTHAGAGCTLARTW